MLAAAAGGASAEAELRLGAERMPGRTNARYLRRPSRSRADDARKAGKSGAVGSLRLPAPPLLALLLLALLRAAAVAGTHDGAATNNKTTTLR